MALAAYLAAAGGVLRLGGVLLDAKTRQKHAKFEGRVQQRNAEQEALLLEREADVAELDAQQEAEALTFDIDTQRRVFYRAFARTRALIGASGTEFSGSNLLVAIDQAREAELAIDALRLTSERRQLTLFDEAALARFGAEEARTTGAFARDIGRRTGRNIERALPLTIAASVAGSAASVASAPRGGR